MPGAAAYYAARGLAYAKAEAYEDALNDFGRAIELEPRGPQAYAFRAWTYRQQQQPELGLRDVERALKIDPNSAEAYWARGEISELLGRTELAVADLRKALALNSGVREAARALERLGVGMQSDAPEVSDARLEGWRVFRDGRQYVATNQEYPRLTVNLEMVGKGQPRILEWEVKKAPFAGIGVLRFFAGSVEAASGPEDVEHAAVIDLQSSSVVAVEVQRQGQKQARWTWDDGKLSVASADGLSDDFQLRQATPKEPIAAAPRREPWRKPKSLFDFLFGN